MIKRRDFLAALVATPIILTLKTSPIFAQGMTPSDFLNISQVLTGRYPLDPSVAERIQSILLKRDAEFVNKLRQLDNAIGFSSAQERDKVIARLNEEDAQTAIQIVSAWYLGYIGTPSNTNTEYDAEFVTYLSALMYEPTKDNTTLPSYPRGGRINFGRIPKGVKAPPMDPNIKKWGTLSPKAEDSYTTADPAYILMVQGKAKTLEEANKILGNPKQIQDLKVPKRTSEPLKISNASATEPLEVPKSNAEEPPKISNANANLEQPATENEVETKIDKKLELDFNFNFNNLRRNF